MFADSHRRFGSWGEEGRGRPGARGVQTRLQRGSEEANINMFGKIRLRRALQVVREYSHRTSMHGLRHIVKEGCSMAERIFWFTLVAACGLQMSKLCLEQWLQYRRVPTETVLKDSAVSVELFLFPTVVVCPTQQIDKEVAMPYLRDILREANRNGFGTSTFGPENVVEYVNSSSFPEISEDELNDLLVALQSLGSPDFMSFAKEFFSRKTRLFAALDRINPADFMKRVFPTCDTVFHSCLWKGFPFDCCKHFVVKPTFDSGYCYAFDAEKANKMVCDEVFPASERQKKRCLADQSLTYFGPGSGVRVFLETIRDADSLVAGDAMTSQFLARVSVLRGEATIAVEAVPAATYELALSVVRIETDPRLSSLPVMERSCVFDWEWPGENPEDRNGVPMKYTLHRCINDCKRQHVLERCKCLPYPLSLGDANAVCSLSQTGPCIAKTSHLINFFRLPRKLPGFGYGAERYRNNGVSCGRCMRECNSTFIVVDAQQPLLPSPDDEHLTRLVPRTMVDVFYAGPNAAQLFNVRPKLSLDKLLVTVGAVANLFLGMSYLTLLELVVIISKCVWILFLERHVKG